MRIGLGHSSKEESEDKITFLSSKNDAIDDLPVSPSQSVAKRIRYLFFTPALHLNSFARCRMKVKGWWQNLQILKVPRKSSCFYGVFTIPLAQVVKANTRLLRCTDTFTEARQNFENEDPSKQTNKQGQ